MADHPRRRQPQNFFAHPTSPTAMIMEDYCTSPRHFRSSTWSANAVPVTPPAEVFQLRPGKKTPEAAATIRDLIDEPIFWRGYTSDEEVASPLVDDNRSFDSGSFCYDSEDVVSIHDAPTPQRSTQSLGVSRPDGTQAQAVQFMSAGKAKFVSMPTPRVVRTAPSSPTRLPVSKMNRMNIEGRTINFSRTITPKSSGEGYGESMGSGTTKRSAYAQRVVRRKPDVPALQAMSRSQSPSYDNMALMSPSAARRAGFVEPEVHPATSPLSEGVWFSQSTTPDEERPSASAKQTTAQDHDFEPEAFPAQEASPMPDSPPLSLPRKRSSNYVLVGSSSTRRPAPFSTGLHSLQDAYTIPDSSSLSRPRLLRKLSSTFSFRTFNRPSRQDSVSSSESEKLRAVSETTSKPAHPISDMHIPTRTSSKPLPKMVPRGANERAPPIVIPPCPDDYDDGDLPARWPQRKDSATTGLAAETTHSQAEMRIERVSRVSKVPTHQRRKSHSTSSGSGSS